MKKGNGVEEDSFEPISTFELRRKVLVKSKVRHINAETPSEKLHILDGAVAVKAEVGYSRVSMVQRAILRSEYPSALR